MGIIKTAMMGGVALYGFEHVSKLVVHLEPSSKNILTTYRAAESRKQHSENPQQANKADPEYLESLEWKRQSAQRRHSTSYQPAREQDCYLDEPTNNVQEYYSMQQLHLIQPQHTSPPYNHASLQQEFQPLIFVTPRKNSPDGGSVERSTSRQCKGLEWGSLIDQGMDMLQARRGSDQIQKRRSAEI